MTLSGSSQMSLLVQSPVVWSCLDIVEDRRHGSISHAQAVIKLIALLPKELLEGVFIRYLKQLADIECTRAITGQHGHGLNTPNDQQWDTDNQGSSGTP